MHNEPKKESNEVTWRVFPDEEGNVYLLLMLDEQERHRVRVNGKVSLQALQDARKEIIATLRVKAGKPQAAKQEEARREIEAVLDPMRAGNWLSRAMNAAYWTWGVLFAVLGALLVTWIAYKGLQFSSNLPEWIHLVVLGLYGLAVIRLVRWIATTRRRWERGERMDPYGLLMLTGLILIVAAAVFASLTFLLYNHGLVNLDPVQGTQISEEHLLDFYMWHLLKLVPLLKVNDVLKWSEPISYSQGRVGFLILLFQGSVVVPSIAAVRFYWENRHKFGLRARAFVYEREWSPDGDALGNLKNLDAT